MSKTPKGKSKLPIEEKKEPKTDLSRQSLTELTHLDGMYKEWFLDYASYVILERAVPTINDGLKPVQRRILHAMNEMHDGRYHKVANIIGQTMQYHPHGDAAIGEALVNIGQKDLLIDAQGNWGDVRTGDSAAAPRYIEARLSKFAQEVLFHQELTEWQLSYDGRKREPIQLPVKFPLLLAHGVEGIAVGLSTKILPHNFCELIQASIHILQGKNPVIFPDFFTGGQVDVTNYNGGEKGGKVRVRAKIDEVDKKNLVIKEIPFSTTTTSLIESIIKANDNGKIKIKKVTDNTAKDVEILIELAPGVSPDVTVDALYAFTECEVSISPNACVIIDDKPHFLSVQDILRKSTDHTLYCLRRELEIKRNNLMEKWHFSSLEKIFIENKIYRRIEECETWEAVIKAIDDGLTPFKKKLKRAITEDDIVRLTEIKIKRISKFDSFKADTALKELENELAEVNHHLSNLIDYAIDYFKNLLKKYGKGKERRTEIKTFDTIQVKQVAIANQKLYVNRDEGFIGYGLKKDEYISDCSDLDDIIVFLKNGKMVVTRIQDKQFVGKDIIHVSVWKKNDERMTYHMIYLDGDTGITFAKRFNVTAITRDKEYDLTKGSKGSKVIYFSFMPNGETEEVTVSLAANSKARTKVFDYDFGELGIKGRNSIGNILTKWPVKKVLQLSIGPSSLGGRKIWYDDSIGRLNVDERGKLIGEFNTDDWIIVIYRDGTYEITSYELTNRYDPDQVMVIRKYDPKLVITAVYFDGEQKVQYVKRFQIETNTADKRFLFISESRGSRLIFATFNPRPEISLTVEKGKTKDKVTEKIRLDKFMDVKGWKAQGNRLTQFKLVKLQPLTTEPEIVVKEAKPKLIEPEDPTKDQLGLFGKGK